MLCECLYDFTFKKLNVNHTIRVPHFQPVDFNIISVDPSAGQLINSFFVHCVHMNNKLDEFHLVVPQT